MVGQHFSLVQLPSLVVTRWDVMPGDNKHDCFPVRDPVYLTNMKMELTFESDKVGLSFVLIKGEVVLG